MSETSDMGGGIDENWLRSNVVLIPEGQSDSDWDNLISSILLPDSRAHKLIEKQEEIQRNRFFRKHGKNKRFQKFQFRIQ